MIFNPKKIQRDIRFYFWMGVTLYVGSCVLNIIHLYQWKGRELVDFAFHLFLLSVNVGLISRVKELSVIGRRLFLAKAILFTAFFYPQIVLTTNEWAYSKHWPHGILQRCFNMGIVFFEIYFTFYLIKRSVRYVFNHPDEVGKG